jgi:hypothetical protein
MIVDDVWKNHLLPFLLPTISSMRIRLSIVMRQMMFRCHVSRNLKATLANYKRDRVHVVWIAKHVVKMQFCYSEAQILHFSDDGYLHCRHYLTSNNRSGMIFSMTEYLIEREDKFIHNRVGSGKGFQSIETALSSGDVRCPCILKYYLVLVQIRLRQ